MVGFKVPEVSAPVQFSVLIFPAAGFNDRLDVCPLLKLLVDYLLQEAGAVSPYLCNSFPVAHRPFSHGQQIFELPNVESQMLVDLVEMMPLAL